MSQAEIDVLAERQRQIFVEGWDEAHDEKNAHGELAIAAACYALGSARVHIPRPIYGRFFGFYEGHTHAGEGKIAWPWDPKWWKPKDRRRDLVRAAALIIAEIERFDRDKPMFDARTPLDGWFPMEWKEKQGIYSISWDFSKPDKIVFDVTLRERNDQGLSPACRIDIDRRLLATFKDTIVGVRREIELYVEGTRLALIEGTI